ncbi:MAG TPA: DHA2 family efflux MFS transporter permease subunit [Rhizomicrobium sp.]|nr:DHA2 family efflux MFS transporter permease subunit [Rhizomicrobium sp.]
MTAASETYSHTHYTGRFELTVVVWCAMSGVIMQTLDTTICNVALPYMQGGLSASRDEITWVLTSYIVASAVATAPVGWIAARFGKKNVLIAAMLGFTLTSMLCGLADSLDEMIAFRLLQGVCGAALAPLSQTVMLDLYPIEKRGQAMATFGIGIMLGPILGPMLGGYLTDMYNWRWVFYVNLPFGLAAAAGLWLFFKDDKSDSTLKFDWLGFGFMALGVGALQLLLDRGTTKDWFSSTEIVVECALACFGLYLFLVHMLTAENTFLQKAVFKDRNFVLGLFLMFIVGAVLLASTALMPPYLQNLGGHSVLQTGLLLGPRGLGTIVALSITGRIANHVDPRWQMTLGATAMAWSLWQMATWTPSIDDAHLLFVTVVQGFGLGFIFSPLNLVSFATMPGRYRADGTSILNLVRNIGAAIGISITTTVLSDSVQAIHAHLTRFATPFNRALGVNAPSLFFNPQLPTTRAMLNGAIEIRAATEAFANDFLFMFWISLIAFPLIWLIRRPAYSMIGGNGKSKPPSSEA